MARFKFETVVVDHVVGLVVEEAAMAAQVEVEAAVADFFQGNQADDFEASEENLEHLIDF